MSYVIRADGLYCNGTLVSRNTNPADAAWDQGIREGCGIYDQPTRDTFTCPKCHHSYSVRRGVKFVGGELGMLVDYIKSPYPGCPMGC